MLQTGLESLVKPEFFSGFLFAAAFTEKLRK